MKKLLLLFFFIPIITAYGQDEAEKPSYYITSKTIPLAITQCDIAGVPTGAGATNADINSRFYKVGEAGNDIIVIFLFYTTNPVKFALYNAAAGAPIAPLANGRMPALAAIQRKFFLMSKTAFQDNCTPVYTTKFSKSAKFTSSAVTLPVKLRLKDFDFDKNFSLGVSGGIKTRISKYNSNYVNALLALNISTNDLDSFSTKGKVAGQPIKNVATFSPALGIVFEFGKAQVGIFSGIDLMSKSNRNKFEWIYHGKPWISLGFGISILGKEGDNKSAKTGNDSQ